MDYTRDHVHNVGMRRTVSRVIHFASWALLGLTLLLFLPGLIASVWVPSCLGCHTMESSSLSESHDDVSCTQCHGGTSTWDHIMMRNQVLYSMVLGFSNPQRQVAVRAKDTQCFSCHRSIMDGSVVHRNGLLINHETCAAGLSCTTCHSQVGHALTERWATQYSMDLCLRCHSSAQVSNTQECAQCHDGNHTSPTPERNSSFQVVHGPNWQRTHGMGDMATCSACHGDTFCTPCHGADVPHNPMTILQTHGSVAKQPDNKCETCHSQPTFCSDCHGIEMPHPSTFLLEHSRMSISIGSTPCNNCHVDSDCTDCHSQHIHPGGAQR